MRHCAAQDALCLVARRALELSDDDGVLILLAEGDERDRLTVRSGAGERCQPLIGSTIAARAPHIDDVFRSGKGSSSPISQRPSAAIGASRPTGWGPHSPCRCAPPLASVAC